METKYYIFLFAFLGCTSSSENDQTTSTYTDTSYYDSGNIKEINNYINDNKKQGISVSYFENSDTMSVAFYHSGVKDSVETLYYPSGDIKTMSSWQKGILVGEQINYFDEIRRVYYTIKNSDTIRVEEQMISEYLFHDTKGNVKYYRKYNSEGDLIKEEGSGIIIVHKLHDLNSIEVNDTIKLQYLLASPRFVHRGLKIVEYHNNNLIEEKALMINEEYTSAFHNTIVSKPGEYKIYGISFFEDAFNSNVKIDTALYTFLVK